MQDGIPCGHPGCLNHVSHPCENCGRIAGRNCEGDYIIFSRRDRKRIASIENNPTSEKVNKLLSQGWNIVSVEEILDMIDEVKRLKTPPNPPKPPEPPINALVLEGTAGDCPKCESTTKRRWVVGKKYCINPECDYGK